MDLFRAYNLLPITEKSNETDAVLGTKNVQAERKPFENLFDEEKVSIGHDFHDAWKSVVALGLTYAVPFCSW